MMNNILQSNTASDELNSEQLNILGSTFSIATNNVCGLSSPTKQQQILNLIEYKNYDIFALSETKLKSVTSKYLFIHQDCYISWWNCNVDPDQFHASLLNNRKPHWKFNLIRKLEELRFIDCYSLFHEDIRPTWISPNNRSSSSRIDLIWLSESLHYDILYSDHHFNHI